MTTFLQAAETVAVSEGPGWACGSCLPRRLADVAVAGIKGVTIFILWSASWPSARRRCWT